MAATQYIGARYVPMFYTNPTDNSNNWKSGVEYEPLTIVTDLNQSYTSKIPVPASVGRPSENPTYWILTGAYNAQVEEYRQEVITLEEKMALVDRSFILIGDSFGVGYDGDTQTVVGGWIQRCAGFIQAGGGTAYYNTRSGQQMPGVAGFASSLTFLSLLQAIKEDHVSDPESITDIIVFGGSNDIAVINNVPAAISTFIAYCKTTFPKATIKIGAIGSDVGSMINIVSPKYRTCLEYGVEYVKDLEALFLNPDYISADNVHLKATGYALYAPYVMNAILTGHTAYKFGFTCALTDTPTFQVVATGACIAFEYTESNIYMWMEADASTPGAIFLAKEGVNTQNAATNSIAGLARWPKLPASGKKFWGGEFHKVTAQNDIILDCDGFMYINTNVPDLRFNHVQGNVPVNPTASFIPFKFETICQPLR